MTSLTLKLLQNLRQRLSLLLIFLEKLAKWLLGIFQAWIMSVLGLWLLIALAFSLTGCGNSDMSDLQSYVAQVKKRPNPQVDPLPTITPVPPVNYCCDPDNRRDPFKVNDANQDENAIADSGQKGIVCDTPEPNFNRQRFGLESMPLDSLTMVGTMNDTKGGLIGIVKDKSEIVYRVSVGQYVGQNFGRIEYIAPAKIEIVELKRDDRGCWVEFPASIALPEDNAAR